jgi:hypothetical protein
MKGLFVIATVGTAHGKPAFGDTAHGRFEDSTWLKIRGCHKRAKLRDFENQKRKQKTRSQKQTKTYYQNTNTKADVKN